MLKLAVLCVLVTNALATDPRINANDNASCRNVASAYVFPFIASLRTPAGGHFCGGTILNSVNILTAAHCLIGRPVASTTVFAGSHLLHSGGQTRTSGRFIIHANYNANTLANDIGVIRLATPLSMGDNTQQIALNTANTGAVAAIFIGWGRTSAGAVNNILQQLATQTLTHAECQSGLGNAFNTGQICAVACTIDGGCNGDSGGPLVQTSNGAQLGIASFERPGACANGIPRIFTRVSQHINWITNSVNT